MGRKKRILLVSDNDTVAQSVSKILQQQKYEIILAQSAESALEMLESEDADLVISGLKMPGMSGMEFLKELRDWDTRMPVIFVNDGGTPREWQEALESEASATISKPIRKEGVLKALNKALQEDAHSFLATELLNNPDPEYT